MSDETVLDEPVLRSPLEKAAIAALLIDPTRLIDIDLQPGDFYSSLNADIFTAMQALASRGAGIDLNTILAELGDKIKFSELSGYVAMTEVNSAHAVDYAADVKQYANRRAVLHIAQNLAIAATTGGDLAQIKLPEIKAQIEAFTRKTTCQIIGGIKTADSILTATFEPPVWVIPDLLPTGITIVAGPPKVGKSWLALQIVQAVGAGGKALDKDVEYGNALYLALEDSDRRLAERMKLQNWPSGLPVDFVTTGNFGDKVGDLRNGGSERLANTIAERGYKVVIIDTFSRAMPGRKQNEVEDMTAVIEPVFNVAHKLNCGIVFIDHHKKASGFDSDVVADILGSTAKGAMADTLWGLYRKRGKATATLEITGRDVLNKTLDVTWDPLTCSWQCEGDVGAIVLTERRQEIINLLDLLGKAELPEIAKELGQPKSNTFSRLQDLVAQGLVKKERIGIHVYYENVCNDP